MGAWGAKSFQNDDACDWVYELEEDSDLAVIEETLAAIAEADKDDYLEAPECSTAIGAAEVVAALLQRPSPDLPDEAKNWVQNFSGQIPATLPKLAVRTITRIKSDSELKELWDESDEADEWYAVINELEERLKNSALSGSPIYFAQ
jgi:hypothetical protein